MPIDSVVSEFAQDEQYNALPYDRKRRQAEMYFDSKLADDEFYTLSKDEQNQILDNFVGMVAGAPPEDYGQPDTAQDAPQRQPMKPFETLAALGGDDPTMYDTADRSPIERIGEAWETGKLNTELGMLRSEQLMGNDTPEVRDKIAALKAKMPAPYEGDRDLLEQAVSAAAEMIPIQLAGMKQGRQRGMEQLARQPSNFGAAAVTAQAGTVESIGRIEAGLAYDELLDLKDKDGNRLDPTIAKSAAAAVGIINGLIETAQVATLAKTIPGLNKVFSSAIKEAVVDAVKKKTLKNVALKAAGRYVGVVAAETGQEITQEATNIIAAEVAKRVDEQLNGSNIPAATRQEITNRLLETAKQSALAFSVMAAPGTVVQTATDARNIILDPGEENTTPKAILTGQEDEPSTPDQQTSVYQVVEGTEQKQRGADPAEKIRAGLKSGELTVDHVRALKAEIGPDHPLSGELDRIIEESRTGQETTGTDTGSTEPASTQETDQPDNEVPQWIVDLNDSDILIRARNLRQNIGTTAFNEAQAKNLAILHQEIGKRGIKRADESAEVLGPELERQEAAETAQARVQAVNKITGETGKSAQQSAQDMLIEEEQLNNRIQKERLPQARKVAEENSGLVTALLQLENMPSTDEADHAVRGAKIQEIEDLVDEELQTAKPEDLLRAKMVFKHEGRHDLTALIDGELQFRAYQAKSNVDSRQDKKYAESSVVENKPKINKVLPHEGRRDVRQIDTYQTIPGDLHGEREAGRTDAPGVMERSPEGDNLDDRGQGGGRQEVAPPALPPPLFRKRQGLAHHGRLSSKDVRTVVDKLSAKWQNAPTVEIVQRQQDLPRVIQRAARDGDIIDGAYHDGKVYIVADNMADAGHTTRVILHEAIGHHGLRGVLGDSIQSTLRDVYISKRAPVQAIAKEYGLDLSKNDDRLQAAEEFIAREAEKDIKSGWVDRVISAVRSFIRKINPFLTLSDAEIRKIVADARRYVESPRESSLSHPQESIQPAAATVFNKRRDEDTSKEKPAPMDPAAWAKQFAKDYIKNDPESSESVEKLKAAAKSDQPLHDEANGLFGYVRERFGKGFIDDDLKWYHRAFGLPYWLGKKFESMKKAVDIEIQAAETRSEELFKDYDGALGRIQEGIPKDKKKMQALRDLIWKWDGERFPKDAVHADWFLERDDGSLAINDDHYDEIRACLTAEGEHDAVIDAFLIIRRKLDEKFIDAEKVLQVEKLEPELIEEYRANLNKIRNYFPHKRMGNAHVSIIDNETGTVVYREHYGTLADRTLPINRKAKARAEQWLDERIAVGIFKGRPKSDFQIKQGTVKKLPDETFFQLPVEAIQTLVAEAGKRLESSRAGYEAQRLYNKEGRTQKEAMETARRRMRADMEKALSEAVADVFKARGWAAHAIGRKGVPGHETEDIFGILFDYLSGYAGFKTKISRARAHHDNLMKVDPKQHPAEYRHLSKYVKDMLANQDNVDRAVDTLRGLFFVKYLGFVIKSGLVNLTQNIVMSAPVLSQYTKGGILKAERILGKAMVDTRRALTSKAAWTGKKIDYMTLAKNEQAALQEMVESGASMDLFLKELKGNLPGAGWTKYFKKFVDKSGIFMGIAEKFNRASTGLAAYRVAVKDMGKNHDEAVAFAKQIIYDSHFIYGKINLPTAMRGGDFQKVARAGYTFRSFSHNYLSAMSHMLLNSGATGRKAFARSMRNLILVGGLSAVPFFQAMSQAFLWLLGDDDEDMLTNVRRGLPNEWLRDLVVYGLPGVAGVDLTGSLSIEVPRSWKELAGVPYAAIEDTANMVESFKSGNTYRALSETPFTPIVVRNAMRGLELHNIGQYTRSGRAINTYGEKGPRKIDKVELILKSLAGLQPVSSSKAYSSFVATQKMKDALQEKKSKWASRYVNAMVRQDADAMEKVKNEVRTWNEKAKQEGKPYKIIVIRDAVRYRLQDNYKYMPKRLRREARRIADAWQ